MELWVCNKCHAEIPKGDTSKEPHNCPLCRNNGGAGFSEGEREDSTDDDQKYTKKVETALSELESYEEGCEPEDMRFCFDD